jgi:mannosyl-oligosaccharide glucosidase
MLSGEHVASAVVLVLGALAYIVYKKKDDIFRPAGLTPLRAPKMVDNPEFSGQYANDMLWGSYRSGLYFGMRTR